MIAGRYVTTVSLDGGALVVSPVGTGTRATVARATAEAMFEATDAVQGSHTFAILGLGLATVASSLETPPTTTSGAPPASSTVSTTSAPSAATAETTTSTPSSTSSTTTSTPSSAPSTTTSTPGSAPPQGALPRYDDRLAWVGITWGGPASCPGATTTQPSSTATTAYTAVLIDARTGQDVLAFRSQGTPCTGDAGEPSVSRPNELLSVAWQPVGPASTAVQVTVPPCGRYYGWTDVPTSEGGVAVQVVAAVPFDPACGATTAQTVSVDQVVPLGPEQGVVAHAPLGPVSVLTALPDT